jgi:hypothetical protein
MPSVQGAIARTGLNQFSSKATHRLKTCSTLEETTQFAQASLEIDGRVDAPRKPCWKQLSASLKSSSLKIKRFEPGLSVCHFKPKASRGFLSQTLKLKISGLFIEVS